MPTIAAVASIAAPVAAEAPLLRLPLDCAVGFDCHVQRHVDRDAGPGARDHACGSLTDDGHKGTDFAVPPSAAKDGVTVRAAAAGRVRGLRDGMADIDVTRPQAPDVTGRECGNGVVLDHGDGWETQYCHLRAGSVAVRIGEEVAASQPLGLVGMSGAASFPHLHLSVRRGSAVIDPFRPEAGVGCGTGPEAGLWQVPMDYQPGGMIQIGVSDRVPDYAEMRRGLPDIGLPDIPPEALVVWGYLFGGEAGDEVRIVLTGPAGPLGETIAVLDKPQPMFFRAWGRRAPDGGFPGGPYAGVVEHWRQGQKLDSRALAFSLP